jgi:hypothetical protein
MKIRHIKTITANIVLVSQVVGSLVYAQGSVTSGQATKAPAAAVTQGQTNLAVVKKQPKNEKNFSLGLGLEYSQKVAVEEVGSRESSTDLLIAPSYKINSTFTAAAKGVVSKENSGARQTTVSNTQILLAMKGFEISEGIESLHTLIGVLPTNEESQKQDRLKGAFGTTNGLKFTSKYATIKYLLNVSKNIHEFTVNAEGKPNIEYRIGNTLDLTIPVTEKISLSSAGVYRYGRTYKGFERTGFEINADINYDVSKELSMNLGTSNDGNALKANGVDSNISAYDENILVTRLGLSLSF